MDPEVVNLYRLYPLYPRSCPRLFTARLHFPMYKIACVQKKELYDANSAPGEEDLND
jgi:hypothetical protein